MKKEYFIITVLLFTGIEIILGVATGWSLNSKMSLLTQTSALVVGNIFTILFLSSIYSTFQYASNIISKRMKVRKRKISYKRYLKREKVEKVFTDTIKALKNEKIQLSNDIQGLNSLWGKSIEQNYRLEKEVEKAKAEAAAATKELYVEKKRYQSLHSHYEAAVKELQQYDNLIHSKIQSQQNLTSSAQGLNFQKPEIRRNILGL